MVTSQNKFQAIDKFSRPVMFSMLGNSLFLLTFLLIGPLPYLPMKPSKELIQVCFSKCL